jgi:hypothetical protein
VVDLSLASVLSDVRDVAEYAGMAARLARDLPGYLRIPLTADEARRRLRHGLENRERSLLDMADRAIFANPRSPYRRLLEHAGCERGDLHALVAQEGVEGALRQLAARGVYVTVEEYKGRRPAVRGSARFSFASRDFDNPLALGHYLVLSGGSRGRPTRLKRSLGSVTDAALAFVLTLEAHGITNPRQIYWLGASPSLAFIHFKLGHPVDAWFYPVSPLPLVARLGLRYVGALVGMAGHRLPALVHCDVKEPDPIARWLMRHADADRPVVVNATTSCAVRIASAAATIGGSLPGVTFQCRSEPLSAARRRQIEEVGARAMTSYASAEAPYVAYSCPFGAEADDVHLFQDRYAIVERANTLPEHGLTVDEMLLTSLSMSAGQIAFNMGLGDSARIEERDCACMLGSLGLRTHLSEIRSFEKLSSEGTTFARSNLDQTLEQTLPARFGGTPLDYQVVEEEAADSSTLLVLRVHPDVGAIDEEAMRATLLEELARGGFVEAYQTRLLERAETIVIRRLPPLTTRAGKVLPYHLLRQPRGVRHA